MMHCMSIQTILSKLAPIFENDYTFSFWMKFKPRTYTPCRIIPLIRPQMMELVHILIPKEGRKGGKGEIMEWGNLWEGKRGKFGGMSICTSSSPSSTSTTYRHVLPTMIICPLPLMVDVLIEAMQEQRKAQLPTRLEVSTGFSVKT